MQIPTVEGTIDRRILVNYRVDPDVLQAILPPPFRVKQVGGVGMAGICLIRLQHMRPRGLPGLLGTASENAAHRIAVTWDEEGVGREGVFVPRRDSSSLLNKLVGGTFFPGVHHHARFEVDETPERLSVRLESDDGLARLSVVAHPAPGLPAGSVFGSLAEASRFFEAGAVGYSVTPRPGVFDGLELYTDAWEIQPLEVEEVTSSFFEDRALFPAGSAEFDCALLMRDVPHEWRGRERLSGN